MRFSILAMALSLLMMIGFWASAQAEPVQVDVRPGLYLVVEDGKLAPHWQYKLDHLEDAEAKKKVLASLIAGLEHHLSRFNDYVALDLCAEGWSRCELMTDAKILEAAELSPAQLAEWKKTVLGRGHLTIYYQSLTDRLRLSFVVVPDRPYEINELKKLLDSAEFRVRVDDQLIGAAGDWMTLPDGGGTDSYFILLPASSKSPEAWRKFESELVLALRHGRKVNIQTTFSNGENLLVDFDLTGLDEALNIMARKKAEVDLITAREIEELKKQLAAMD